MKTNRLQWSAAFLAYALTVVPVTAKAAPTDTQVIDVALADRGLLVGQVVDSEGAVQPDVEVAVLPRETRPILGLSALRQASPFRFSVEPPTLELTGCGGTLTAAAD